MFLLTNYIIHILFVIEIWIIVVAVKIANTRCLWLLFMVVRINTCILEVNWNNG